MLETGTNTFKNVSKLGVLSGDAVQGLVKGKIKKKKKLPHKNVLVGAFVSQTGPMNLPAKSPRPSGG